MITWLWFACSEVALAPEEADTGLANGPDLRVDPPAVLFPTAAPGLPTEATLTLENVGVAELSLFGLAFLGATSFTSDAELRDVRLAPGASTEVVLRYSALTVEDRGVVEVLSDDPDTPSTSVPLEGHGLVPDLSLLPDPFDFGEVPVGCTRADVIHLRNDGLAPLHPTAITLAGAGMLLSTPLPAAVQPGETVDLAVAFSPAAIAPVEGQLYVVSDDPAGAEGIVVRGAGTDELTRTDDFVQSDGPWPEADIVLFVDQSSSMDDDLLNLLTNFDIFADVLAEAQVDWRLMVVTDDDGCHSGAVLDPGSTDLAGIFESAVRDTGGVYTEAGLYLVAQALAQSGSSGCNAGFLRPTAKTLAILVSDEADQSPSPWDTLTTSIRAVAPTTSLHAVAGDYPEGCPTASPGNGYYQAALETGGVYTSICDAAWATTFEAIAATTASGQTDTFPLSTLPVVESLRVSVDETPVEGWTYDADANAVVFSAGAVPPSLAHVQATYLIAADCPAG